MKKHEATVSKELGRDLEIMHIALVWEEPHTRFRFPVKS